MRTLNQERLNTMAEYINTYQKEKGRSPSYREIMHYMGMSSLNLVQRYVLGLEREGKITRTRLGNRAARRTNSLRRALLGSGEH